MWIATVMWFYFLGGASAFHLAVNNNGPKCGEVASNSRLHSNPWTVLLEFWRRDHQEDIRCGATLIDDLHLVTAAHCAKIKYSKLIARLGEHDLTTDTDCVGDVCKNGVVRIEVEEVFIHPDFDGTANDIAVLRLKEPAPYTDMIRPACLPSTQFSDVTFYASGWGEDISTGELSTTKKVIALPSWKNEDCHKFYKTQLPDKVICAGGVKGVDTCRGDSGGPLVLVREKTELWGVTSMGNTDCGGEGSPGIYTNVKDYANWIMDVTKTK